MTDLAKDLLVRVETEICMSHCQTIDKSDMNPKEKIERKRKLMAYLQKRIEAIYEEDNRDNPNHSRS